MGQLAQAAAVPGQPCAPVAWLGIQQLQGASLSQPCPRGVSTQPRGRFKPKAPSLVKCRHWPMTSRASSVPSCWGRWAPSPGWGGRVGVNSCCRADRGLLDHHPTAWSSPTRGPGSTEKRLSTLWLGNTGPLFRQQRNPSLRAGAPSNPAPREGRQVERFPPPDQCFSPGPAHSSCHPPTWAVPTEQVRARCCPAVHHEPGAATIPLATSPRPGVGLGCDPASRRLLGVRGAQAETMAGAH